MARIKIARVENAARVRLRHLHAFTVARRAYGERKGKGKGAEHVFARVTSAKHVAREKRDAPAHRGLRFV